MSTEPRIHRRFFLSASAALAVVAVSLSGATVAASDIADSYKDRQVRFLTMGSAGGGYDTYLRTIIPYIERKTGARLVPVNEPGAGGLNAMNRLLQAPADGYTIFLTGGEAAASSQLYGSQGVNYDLRELTWIAQVSGPPKIVMVADNFRYKSFEDALKAKHTFIWGGSGRTDGNSDYSAILAHALGFDSRIIVGYKGSGGINMAIEQGEIDARIITSEAAVRFTRAGKFRVILTLSRERAPEFPDVPTVYEVASPSPEMARWLDWRANMTALGRVIVAAPGTPKARVDFLRTVMKEVLNDPEYIAEARKRGLNPDYMDGESLEKLVRETMDLLSPEELAEVKDVAMNKYYGGR